MCHANFSAEFSPHINFIGGENGSGKSAVLCGITFGLGGSATTIGRGAALKDYIGCHDTSCTVRITVVQPKQDRYTFNNLLEGDLVVIERTANKSGASTFKLLDANGKVLSTKKLDLDNFKQHHNIQVENPAVFMSQVCKAQHEKAQQKCNDF